MQEAARRRQKQSYLHVKKASLWGTNFTFTQYLSSLSNVLFWFLFCAPNCLLLVRYWFQMLWLFVSRPKLQRLRQSYKKTSAVASTFWGALGVIYDLNLWCVFVSNILATWHLASLPTGAFIAADKNARCLPKRRGVGLMQIKYTEEQCFGRRPI